MLFVNDSQAIDNLGWFGVNYWSNESTYNNVGSRLTGYPCGPNNSCGTTSTQKCGASPRVDERCDGWMYTHSVALPVNAWDYDGELKLYQDASSGQSGSPVYRTYNNALMAIWWGSRGSTNHAARFRSSMWNDVCDWIAAVPSAYGTHSLCN